MKKSILFLLSGNIATTPRAKKAICLASDEGWQVDVLCADRGTPWREMDLDLTSGANATIRTIQIDRSAGFIWLVVSFCHRACRYLSLLLPKSCSIAAFGSEKTSLFLHLHCRSIQKKYDLIETHGYGAMMPGIRLAQRLDISVVVDIEDYHQGERCAMKDPEEHRRRETVVQCAIRSADVITYASPAIWHEIEQQCGQPKKSAYIANTFPRGEFRPPVNSDNPRLRLVWFSQMIGEGRGLEELIEAAVEWQAQIEITLIGNISPSFRQKLSEISCDFVTVRVPVPQEELHQELFAYDVGLCLELPGDKLNSDLCLANKLFAYALAGLFIVATDTTAQRQFMIEHPAAGMLCKNSTVGMRSALEKIVAERTSIRQYAHTRYEYAKALSWDAEKIKLSNLWERALHA